MKKYMLLLPVLFILLVNGCVGGGDDGEDSGGFTPNPTPAPLPVAGSITYALLAVTGSKQIYSAPIDVNGNLLWTQGKYTATNVAWQNPYYIIVDSTNTNAYIADAPLGTDGSVYKCALNNNGTLTNCSTIINNIQRPVSMALQGNYLYVSSAVTNGAISACNLASNPVSCTIQSATKQSNLEPVGVAVNGSKAYVTYGCVGADVCTNAKNALFSFDLNPNTGNISNPYRSVLTSTLSNPTDLAVNQNYLYISNFAFNSVSQLSTNLLDNGPAVSTIFKGNFEISMSHNGKFAYIINGARQGKNNINGYISKCTVQSSGLLNNSCTPLTDPVLNQPYGIAITGEL